MLAATEALLHLVHPKTNCVLRSRASCALGEAGVDGRVALPKNMVLDEAYRVERVIGTGGFGITYAAEDLKLGTKVALKEYYPAEFGARDNHLRVSARSENHKKTFEWGRTSFLQEARTLARFRHPSIVLVTRVFEALSTAYMVMDFEKGQPLEGWLKGLGRPPAQEELDRIAAPLLDALAMMHAENFLHRDIAPDNIIIRADGTPVLLDFGAARRAVAEMSRTLTGVVKAGYSPHEQYADSRHQGPWSDIYALGATFYRAVTGRPPEEATIRVTDDQLSPAAVAAVRTYRQSFLRAIDECLKVQPSERPQSIVELRPMLLRRETPPPVPDTQQIAGTRKIERPTSRPARGQWLWITSAATLAILAGSYGGFEYMRWQGTSAPKVEASTPTVAITSPQPVSPPATIKCVEAQVGNKKRCLKPEDSFRDCPNCPEMVVVPAGSFTMGSPAHEPERYNDETQVRVTIPAPFAVGIFAVTFDEWDACVAGGGCSDYKPADQGWGRGKHPVINVSWDDAKTYAAWISRKTGKSYRLLSEAEREYVTRAGTSTSFWWGPSITPKQANYDGSANPYQGGGSKGEYPQRTMPVDSFEANPWGLFNVHGNVWEWTEDCWNDSNNGNPGNGRARTTGECKQRVVRGGSWSDEPRFLRSALRSGRSADDRFKYRGFRLARTLNP